MVFRGRSSAFRAVVLRAHKKLAGPLEKRLGQLQLVFASGLVPSSRCKLTESGTSRSRCTSRWLAPESLLLLFGRLVGGLFFSRGGSVSAAATTGITTAAAVAATIATAIAATTMMVATAAAAVVARAFAAAAGLLFAAAASWLGFFALTGWLFFAAGLLAALVVAAEKSAEAAVAARAAIATEASPTAVAAAAAVTEGHGLRLQADEKSGNGRESQRQTNDIALHQTLLQN